MTLLRWLVQEPKAISLKKKNTFFALLPLMVSRFSEGSPLEGFLPLSLQRGDFSVLCISSPLDNAAWGLNW